MTEEQKELMREVANQVELRRHVLSLPITITTRFITLSWDDNIDYLYVNFMRKVRK